MKRADLIERLEVALINMEYALADAGQDICPHRKLDEVVIGWRQAKIREASEALQTALIALNLEQPQRSAEKLAALGHVEPSAEGVCSN